MGKNLLNLKDKNKKTKPVNCAWLSLLFTLEMYFLPIREYKVYFADLTLS